MFPNMDLRDTAIKETRSCSSVKTIPTSNLKSSLPRYPTDRVRTRLTGYELEWQPTSTIHDDHTTAAAATAAAAAAASHAARNVLRTRRRGFSGGSTVPPQSTRAPMTQGQSSNGKHGGPSHLAPRTPSGRSQRPLCRLGAEDNSVPGGHWYCRAGDEQEHRNFL